MVCKCGSVCVCSAQASAAPVSCTHTLTTHWANFPGARAADISVENLLFVYVCPASRRRSLTRSYSCTLSLCEPRPTKHRTQIYPALRAPCYHRVKRTATLRFARCVRMLLYFMLLLLRWQRFRGRRNACVCEIRAKRRRLGDLWVDGW